MSVPIVFDEWILDELSGKSSKKKQEEAFNLLVKMFNICDKMVFLEGSPFAEKWDRFYREAQMDTNRRAMSQYLLQAIFTNSHKIYRLEQGDVSEIPDEIKKLVPPSDHYVISCYLKVRKDGGFIVTTDGRWDYKNLHKKHFDIRERNAFIKEYMAKDNGSS